MSALTTLANAKAWIGVKSADDDALLTRLIGAASDYIETWTNRVFASQSFNEIRDGKGGACMVFADYPVTAVSSVVVDGIPIPAAVSQGGTGYAFDAGRIVLMGHAFTRGIGNVRLSYTAGYVQTPPEIEQACIELVALRYKERERIGHQSKSLAGETVTFMVKDFPDSVHTILNSYKKVVPL